MAKANLIWTRNDWEKAGRTLRGPADLRAVRETCGVGDDWHEPDNQGVTAKIEGRKFDNAGIPSEMVLVIQQEGKEVARVNVASICSWACGHRATPSDVKAASRPDEVTVPRKELGLTLRMLDAAMDADDEFLQNFCDAATADAAVRKADKYLAAVEVVKAAAKGRAR